MKLKVKIELEDIATQIAKLDDESIRLFIQDIFYTHYEPTELQEAVLADMLRLVRGEDNWSDSYNPEVIEKAYPQI